MESKKYIDQHYPRVPVAHREVAYQESIHFDRGVGVANFPASQQFLEQRGYIQVPMNFQPGDPHPSEVVEKVQDKPDKVAVRETPDKTAKYPEQCTATTRSKNRCKNEAISGTEFCKTHTAKVMQEV